MIKGLCERIYVEERGKSYCIRFEFTASHEKQHIVVLCHSSGISGWVVEFLEGTTYYEAISSRDCKNVHILHDNGF